MQKVSAVSKVEENLRKSFEFKMSYIAPQVLHLKITEYLEKMLSEYCF